MKTPNPLLTSDPHAVAAFVNAPAVRPADAPAVATAAAPSFEETTERDGTPDDAPPSREDLLERAASLGPARMTWESFVLPSDPILKAKMQPHIAERRARFRKVVQAAVGACFAFCLVATGVSLSSGSEQSVASSIKSAPAAAVVPVEKLDIPARTKARARAKAVSHASFAAHASKFAKHREPRHAQPRPLSPRSPASR